MKSFRKTTNIQGVLPKKTNVFFTMLASYQQLSKGTQKWGLNKKLVTIWNYVVKEHPLNVTIIFQKDISSRARDITMLVYSGMQGNQQTDWQTNKIFLVIWNKFPNNVSKNFQKVNSSRMVYNTMFA